MIKVKFDPDDLPPDKKAEWDQLQLQAQAATEKIIEEWETWVSDPETRDKKFPSDKFDDRVWKGIRDFLVENVFHNKCAYCEKSFVGMTPHAEHFRPKAQVRFKVTVGDKESYKMGRTTDETGNEIDHPGYFWLAYNWKNLLPACHTCNMLEGKKDQFPLASGGSYVAVKKLTQEEIDNLHHKMTKRKGAEDIFYLEPEDLDELEDPLLLHPYFGDDPRKHLVFGVAGMVAPRDESPKGSHSIAVFDLNNDAMREARQFHQDAAYLNYLNALANSRKLPEEEKKKKNKEALAAYIKGEAAYSSAVLDYLHYEFTGAKNIDPYILRDDPGEAEDPEPEQP